MGVRLSNLVNLQAVLSRRFVSSSPNFFLSCAHCLKRRISVQFAAESAYQGRISLCAKTSLEGFSWSRRVLLSSCYLRLLWRLMSMPGPAGAVPAGLAAPGLIRLRVGPLSRGHI